MRICFSIFLGGFTCVIPFIVVKYYYWCVNYKNPINSLKNLAIGYLVKLFSTIGLIIMFFYLFSLNALAFFMVFILGQLFIIFNVGHLYDR